MVGKQIVAMLQDLPADVLQHIVMRVLRGAWQACSQAGARLEAQTLVDQPTYPDGPTPAAVQRLAAAKEQLHSSKISVVEAGLEARALAGILCTCHQLCDLLRPAMRRGGLVCNAQWALGGRVAAGVAEPDLTTLPACYIPDPLSGAITGTMHYGRRDPHVGSAAAIVAMAVRADGRLCATIAVPDPTRTEAEGMPIRTEVRLYSLPGCHLQCSMSAMPGVVWTCVALEGSCVIGGDSTGGLQVWALSGGNGWMRADALYQLQGHEAEMVRLAISPDGRFLASSSWSLCLRWQATLRVWSLPSGTSLAVEERTDPDYCVAWAGDTLGLVTESQASPGLELWSPVDDEQARVLMPHPASVLSVAIQRPEDLSSTNEALQMATACVDSCIRLWALPSGLCIRELRPGQLHPSEHLYHVALRGTKLVAGGDGSRLFVWQLGVDNSLHVDLDEENCRQKPGEYSTIPRDMGFIGMSARPAYCRYAHVAICVSDGTIVSASYVVQGKCTYPLPPALHLYFKRRPYGGPRPPTLCCTTGAPSWR